MVEDYNDNYDFVQADQRLFPELTEAYAPFSVIQVDKNGSMTERAQLLQYNFIEAITRCETCEKRWHVPDSLYSSYNELTKWIN